MIRCSLFSIGLRSKNWTVLAFFLIVHIQSPASVANETLNYFVIEGQAAPFQIVDESKQHSGIVSDFLTSILEGSPYQLQVHSYPFKRMIKTINDGDYPHWITYGSSSWSPPQNLNLSECSILTVRHILLPPKGENLTLNSINDLLGQRVILLFGFAYPYLDEYIKAEQLAELRVQSYSSAFKALAFKRAQGFVEMESRIKYNLKQVGDRYDDYNPVDMSNIIPQYDIRFAMSPQMSDDVKRYIDDRCYQLKRTGEYQKIINKYLN